MLERAVDMLAVAAQLPAAVLANDASGAAAIASIAQIPDAATFVLTMRPPLVAIAAGASVGSNRYASLTRPLNDREQSSGPVLQHPWPARRTARSEIGLAA